MTSAPASVAETGELSPFELPGAPAAPLDVREVALEDIALLDNLRLHYHGIDALAATMHTEGQLQPVVVRPAPDAAHGQPFELVFGYRRYLAAQSLGWETIRAEVREVPDERRRRQLIVENLQREDLDPVAEARAMHALQHSTEPPLSTAEVARQIGCDRTHVSHRLKMLRRLAPPALAATLALPPARDAGANAHADAGATEDQPVFTAAPERSVGEDTPETTKPAVGDTCASASAAGEDPVTTPSPQDAPAPAPAGDDLDMLALVADGTISASVAEVIASLDDRASQIKLCRLVVAHDWGVKKASDWALAAKQNVVADEPEALAPLELVTRQDVRPLLTLGLRKDLSALDYQRITVWALLRSGMDWEMLEWLEEDLGYPYYQIWDYLRLLDADQVETLHRRLVTRYVCAAHRFYDLEASLRADLAGPLGDGDD